MEIFLSAVVTTVSVDIFHEVCTFLWSVDIFLTVIVDIFCGVWTSFVGCGQWSVEIFLKDVG